jgi:cell pole-organizing protein PopZ
MANPSTAHEPSMEEILASIRQIISEDGEASVGPGPEAKVPAHAQPEGEAETQPATTGSESAPARAEVAPAKGEAMKPQTSGTPARPAQPQISSMTPSTPAAEAARRAEFQPTANAARLAAPQRTTRMDDKALLSPNSDAAVSGAFSALAHTILAQNARTLEDLVVEMLQPMLRDWLDENLPSLVERLVKEEIERVSRGRR